MPAEVTPPTAQTPAATGTPSAAAKAAPAPAPAAPAAASATEAPKSDKEMEILRREALAANKQLRERDAALTQLRSEVERIKAAEAEAEALKSKNIHAWMEKRLGMSKADLTRALMAASKRLEPGEEAKMQVEELKRALRERDTRAEEERKRAEQMQDEAVTQRAYQMLRHEISNDSDDSFALLREEMDNNPRGWARAIRDYADKYPQKTAREVAADLHAAALARVEKMIQNPAVARALKLGQPQAPAAPTGSDTPRTITSRLTGEVSSGKSKIPASEANKLRVASAIRAWEEAEAAKHKGA